MLCFHDAVHAGGGDRVASVACANPALHPRDDLSDLYRVRSNSQHIERRTFESLVDRLSLDYLRALCWFRDRGGSASRGAAWVARREGNPGAPVRSACERFCQGAQRGAAGPSPDAAM